MNIKPVRDLCCILVCLCLSSKLLAQELPVKQDSKPIVYTEAIESQGSASDLFVKAKEWIMTTFKSAEEVIRVDDPATGQLSLEGQSVLLLYDHTTHRDTLTVPIHFSLDIQTIGGAYRYNLDQIYINCYPENSQIQVPFEILSQTTEEQKNHIRKTLHNIDPDLSESEIRIKEMELLKRYQACRSKGEATIKGIIGLLKSHMRSN